MLYLYRLAYCLFASYPLFPFSFDQLSILYSNLFNTQNTKPSIIKPRYFVMIASKNKHWVKR